MRRIFDGSSISEAANESRVIIDLSVILCAFFPVNVELEASRQWISFVQMFTVLVDD